MWQIYKKEISVFFSSLIGYIVIGVFLVLLGLIMFIFPDFSLLNSNYATLDQLFGIAPLIFLFLIPAITMRMFAEENQSGTIELLVTKPLRDYEIVLGKYLASVTLIVIALVPTLLYLYTVYELGSPRGNIDLGAVLGSYIGLVFLAGSFASVGILASVITDNQIVSFILATFLSFFFYYSFYLISRLPVFVGKLDDFIQKLGMDYHYASMSRGVIDSRDLIYFISFITLFLILTLAVLERKKW